MGSSTIATNRRARFEYEVLQTIEAGIVLSGTEVKSLRQSKVTMSDSYCRVDASHEIWIRHLHISPYEFGNRHNLDPLRDRKLLLHKNEIARLYGQIREKGVTLVPLKLYFKQGLVKVQLGMVRGKKLHDKRQTLKKRDAERDIAQSLKNR